MARAPTVHFAGVTFLIKEAAEQGPDRRAKCELCVIRRNSSVCYDEGRWICGSAYFVVRQTPINLDRFALLKLKGKA